MPIFSTPFRRGLALLLCAQPILWMSDVALAQAIQLPTKDSDTRLSGSTDFGNTVIGSDAPQGSGLFSAPAGAGFSNIFPSGSTNLATPGLANSPLNTPTGAASPPNVTPIDQPIDPNAYICGPGDVLELNFWGLQSIKLRTTIDVEGRVFINKIGYFHLQGKTLSQVRHLLRESVARFFPRLGFDVSLIEPRTFLVQVVDGVTRPGTYPTRAVERVASLITTRASGFSPNASRRRIEIRHRDGTTTHADLLLFAMTGDVKYNPYLLDGDAVRVPFEDLAVTVSGAVNRPGRYELIGSRDLAEAVSLAGGLAPTATHQLPISLVHRGDSDRQHQALIDFKTSDRLPTVALQHEDQILIPSFTEVQQAVTVIGAIAGVASPSSPTAASSGGNAQYLSSSSTVPDDASATRRLPYVRGETVRTLLERVGGVGPLADLDGSYLLRGGKLVALDLHALVALRDLKADRPVELGDTLVIPFKRRNVVVEGAVFAPGPYPFNPTYSIEQYLSLAGGRNRFAMPLSDVHVVTPSGETKDYSPGMQVDPGSSIVVPERNYSRSEVVQLILGAASVLISGVAVVIAASK